MAIIYVGIPAYLLIVGISVRDIVASDTAPTASIAITAIVLFTIVFLWLGLVSPPSGSDRRIFTAIVVLGLLATCIALLGGTSSAYFIVVGAMAGRELQPRLAMLVIVLATGGVAAMTLANDTSLRDTLTQVIFGLVVGLFAYGVARLVESNEQLAAAREELASLAVVSERLRFARDLHDLLGQSLTVIRAKSELASRLLPADPPRAGREIAEVEGLARQALGEVREAVAGFRRTTVASELINARAALEAAGIAADLAANGLEVPPPLDDVLGWTLREAVTNVVRHSGARRCRVVAACEDRYVRLEVADDGHGPIADRGPETGLHGVRERLGTVGGTLELASGPGAGFSLVARVPRAT